MGAALPRYSELTRTLLNKVLLKALCVEWEQWVLADPHTSY